MGGIVVKFIQHWDSLLVRFLENLGVEESSRKARFSIHHEDRS